MNKLNLLLIPFLIISFLLLAQHPQSAIPALADQDEVEGPQFDRGYLSPDFETDPDKIQYDPDKLVYLTIPQLEDLIALEQEGILKCRNTAMEKLNSMGHPKTPSSDDMDSIEDSLECMRIHKANIMLVKKEINKRLKDVSSADPDRKKLKKAQGQANNAIKEGQDSQAEVQEARNKK